MINLSPYTLVAIPEAQTIPGCGYTAVTRAGEYSDEAYAAMLQQLLPVGAAWPREAGTVQAQWCMALGWALSQLEGEQSERLWRLHPLNATEGEPLALWERLLKLPNACSLPPGGPPQTEAQRWCAMMARLNLIAGSESRSLTELAADQGFTITESRPAGFRHGIQQHGDAFGNVRQLTITVTAAPDGDYVCEPFGHGVNRHGNAFVRCYCPRLECLLAEMAPADRFLVFDYSALEQ